MFLRFVVAVSLLLSSTASAWAEAAGIYSLEHKTRIRSTQRAAEAFKKAKCDGVALSREAEAIAEDVENATAHRSVDP